MPLLVGALLLVVVVAGLSLVVWVWAMRRPVAASSGEYTGIAGDERPPMVYVALGAQIGLGLDNDDQLGRNWVEMLREKMPEGTRLVALGRRGVTLGELNQVELPRSVEARPDIVTLWSVVSDATRHVALADYARNLQQALGTLMRSTEAAVLLLNLPDISLLTREVPDEQRALIRGGVEQWNRAIGDASARYGRRVRVVDLFPMSEQLLVRQGDESGRGGLPDGERNSLLAGAVWETIVQGRLLEAT